MRKVELLPTRDCEVGYGPGSAQTFVHAVKQIMLKGMRVWETDESSDEDM